MSAISAGMPGGPCVPFKRRSLFHQVFCRLSRNNPVDARLAPHQQSNISACRETSGTYGCVPNNQKG
jgi:hypothetical protein